jgi:phenylacetate-CoA ligase
VIQAEVGPEVGARPGALDALRADIEARLRAVIGVRSTVQLVPPGQLERTEFKARRVIDNRDLFRELTAR